MNGTLITKKLGAFKDVISLVQEDVVNDRIDEAIKTFEESMGMYESISEKLDTFKIFRDMENRAVTAEQLVEELRGELEELKNSQVAEEVTDLSNTIESLEV